jgi:hypothetical protein
VVTYDWIVRYILSLSLFTPQARITIPHEFPLDVAGVGSNLYKGLSGV